MTVEIRELCCHIFQITLILTYVYSIIIDYVPQKARPIRLLHQRHLLASSALFGVFLKKYALVTLYQPAFTKNRIMADKKVN